MGSKLNTTAKEGDNLSPSFRLVGIRCDVVILIGDIRLYIAKHKQ